MYTKEDIENIHKKVVDIRKLINDSSDEINEIESKCQEIICKNGGHGSIQSNDDYQRLQQLTDALKEKYKERDNYVEREKEANKKYHSALCEFFIPNIKQNKETENT